MGRGLRSKAQVRQGVTGGDFELLQTIAVLNGGADMPATLGDIAKEYGVSRACMHRKVKRLRGRGWVEENAERKVWGVRLTHNGKLLVEIGLGAGLPE